ncbi:bifunctional (p)ppGpp synthetase/guanosine-3',5'-bis(diphosphate) 3'-pyrophosphohydrolase [Psychrobacillus glaciei]|uniref:Bifunctional (P)ppGpp synthetase/guanosine-3',5'-bis(Diphosphate) 3'-pyrophosphohydrolase n=1 Tax=Psychrobacillus glaciei TaxID=2283160 RepID=A0A5J6SMX5_9BACI|nr:HD domain-containing protein [Psychrobacillus glaciei]QFF99139.1 bifunctional (p)ppGpp synthetase/guanosine-3',5'-bis(diphosphate) 3'-pyrophosphohydrolase [Psychrobacillus glaciei]
MVNDVKVLLMYKCKYLSDEEKVELQKAIEFSEKAHIYQKRATGEPYVIHPLEVCLILSEYEADLTTLICALLHDVVEDTEVSLSEIEEHFGSQVAYIVDGLTKFEKGVFEKEEYSAVNTEKLLSMAILDIRIAVVKLADRLHNMRTLAIKRIEKKIPYANETLLFFSPLAEKIGLYKMQEELEDLGFSYLNPPRYTLFKKIMNDYTQVYSEIFNQFLHHVHEEDSSEFIVHTNWKKPPLFQLYNLVSEGHNLQELFTIHITTKTTLNCYIVLGTIHSLFEPVPNQFVDKIAIENHPFLKYLETKVKIEDLILRVIIQDEATKTYYEHGVFAKLKENDIQSLSNSLLGTSIHSVKTIAKNSIAFCELISFELFQKEITVFTPKMDVIILPINSNIIDFAYALDPSLANRMSFAKVNSEFQSPQTVLQDMDIIEIHTKNKITVDAKWLHHVQTSKALKEIMGVVNKSKKILNF